MTSHLAILLNGKTLNLPDDFSIDIDDKNPLFNEVEMTSYAMQIPIGPNRHVVKHIDDVNAELRPVDFEHLPMRVIADGMAYRSGTSVMSDGEVVDGALSMNMESSEQSFDSLIGDLTCREVPLLNAPVIGEKIGDVSLSVSYRYKAKITYDGKKAPSSYTSASTDSVSDTFQPQALGFSCTAVCEEDANHYALRKETRDYPNGNSVVIPKKAISYINTVAAYGETDPAGRAAQYCNARVCYKHYAYDEESKSTKSETVIPGDSTGLYEDYSPYWVLDADRQQSGICFYVLYFLDCLFAHLGVAFDKSALMEVEDFKHLAFFTTHCKYETRKKYSTFKYNSLDEINQWLSSRGCGGKFIVEDPEGKDVQEFTYTDTYGIKHEVFVGKDSVRSISIEAEVVSKSASATIHEMIATSDNFPDTGVKTILDAMYNQFGVKFAYDYERKRVTAYLIRDVFRKRNTPRPFRGKVLTMKPISDKITGVRICYSAESTSKEQQKNVREGKRDYDTDFDYIEYPRNRTIIDKTYKEIFRNISSSDMNVYIDQNTGNAYRVKIDSNATNANEMKPVLFEVGQWKGVELGDCSTKNEDYVTEFSSEFTPITFNDVNYNRELQLASGGGTFTSTTGETSQITVNEHSFQPVLAAYIDEDMEHEFVEQRIRNVLSSPFTDIYLTEVLTLLESYDPSNTDDGNSPLQTYDWGNAIALMRGGGADADHEEYDYNYDGFGNSKWRSVSGEYAVASDTMDAWGNQFDYNGKSPGIGSGERFSLKIRAYKQPEWADKPLCKPDEVDAHGNVTTKFQTRGTADTFLIDYAYFLLHRHHYEVQILTTVAQVADVPNHWKEWWLVGGKPCLINQVKSSISAQTGLGVVTLDIYAL